MSGRNINFYKALQYFENKGKTVIPGVDTLVYKIQLSQENIDTLSSFSYSLTTNTNVYYFQEFDGILGYITINQTRFGNSLTVNLQDDQFSFPAFQLMYNNDLIKRTVYGLTFRYIEIKNINFETFEEHYLYQLVNDIENRELIRFDYKFDVFNTKPNEFIRRLKKYNPGKLEKRKIETYHNAGDLETMYIGCRKNKTIFSRIYDKTKDNRKKRKGIFYNDYPVTTTRVEFQVMRKFITKMGLSNDLLKLYTYLKFPGGIKDGPFFKYHKYDPNSIADVDKYTTDRENRTIKLIKNGVDLRNSCKKINKQQNLRRIRVNLPCGTGKKDDKTVSKK